MWWFVVERRTSPGKDIQSLIKWYLFPFVLSTRGVSNSPSKNAKNQSRGFSSKISRRVVVVRSVTDRRFLINRIRVTSWQASSSPWECSRDSVVLVQGPCRRNLQPHSHTSVRISSQMACKSRITDSTMNGNGGWRKAVTKINGRCGTLCLPGRSFELL